MDLTELYRIARNFKGSPAELQTLLRQKSRNVVSVGDDLSFVVRLDGTVSIDENILEEMDGKWKRLYPFRNCYVFERGYIAWDGRFLRVSREIDEKILEKILSSLNIE